MGIINRTNDVSEQQEAYKGGFQTVIDTNERLLAVVERAQTIQQIQSTCLGISGAPTGMIRVIRDVGTTFNVGLTFLIPAVGVSGAMGGLSLPATGDTRLNLIAGDVVSIIFGGGSAAAATNITVDLVVKNLQDIKTWY